MALHLSNACFSALSRSKVGAVRAVASDQGVKTVEVEKVSLGGSAQQVTRIGIGAWSWGDTSYWNNFEWDGEISLSLSIFFPSSD